MHWVSKTVYTSFLSGLYSFPIFIKKKIDKEKIFSLSFYQKKNSRRKNDHRNYFQNRVTFLENEQDRLPQ